MAGVAWRAGLFASAAAAACVWAPAALADDGSTQASMGSQVDVGGGQSWTVDELEPSSDAIPYRPTGTLWEAEATAQSVPGGLPIIPGFSARAGGVSYPVLWPVPAAEGVNPSALPPGGTAEGKIYFDVTGPPPTAVAYTANGRDTAVWVQPPPVAPSPGGYTAPVAPAPAPRGVLPVAPAPAVVAPAAPAPAPAPAASGRSGTPSAAGSTPAAAATPAPAPAASGSSGTPIAAGSTPAAAPTTAAPTTPAPAMAAPTTAAPTTAAATPMAPAPAAAEVPARTNPAGGSAGTPASPAMSIPTTTVVVPAPAG